MGGHELAQRVESETYSAERGDRRDFREPKETKTFSKTSEFFVWALTVAAVLIAVLVIDGFGPDRGWTLVTALSIGYMISRGLAKSGARKSDYEGYDLTRG
jgi:uncharacterized membrane protein YjjP (DUF1212 family)